MPVRPVSKNAGTVVQLGLMSGGGLIKRTSSSRKEYRLGTGHVRLSEITFPSNYSEDLGYSAGPG